MIPIYHNYAYCDELSAPPPWLAFRWYPYRKKRSPTLHAVNYFRLCRTAGHVTGSYPARRPSPAQIPVRKDHLPSNLSTIDIFLCTAGHVTGSYTARWPSAQIAAGEVLATQCERECSPPVVKTFVSVHIELGLTFTSNSSLLMVLE